MLFTWFGRNWKALPALIHAAPNLFARAAGQGHEKPFWYFAQLLVAGWSGGVLVAFACLGLFIVIRRRDASPYHWLAYYGLSIAIIYSLIPYKTPWLALNLWLPMALFAASAVESLWRWSTTKFPQRATVPAFCVLAALTGVADCARHAPTRLSSSCGREQSVCLFADFGRFSRATRRDRRFGSPEWNNRAAHRGDCCRSLASSVVLAALFRKSDSGSRASNLEMRISISLPPKLRISTPIRLRRFRPEFFGVRPGVLILLWSPAPK